MFSLVSIISVYLMLYVYVLVVPLVSFYNCKIYDMTNNTVSKKT